MSVTLTKEQHHLLVAQNKKLKKLKKSRKKAVKKYHYSTKGVIARRKAYNRRYWRKIAKRWHPV